MSPASVSKEEITLTGAVTCATGQTIEYALSLSATAAPDTGWQESLSFSGLLPNTTYFVWARTRENTGYRTGPASRVGPEIKTKIPAAYTVSQSGGADGTADSTALRISFSPAVSGLSADHITVSGAAKGALTGSGGSYQLSISDILVKNGERIDVEICDFGEYDLAAGPQSVAVYTRPTLSGVSVSGSFLVGQTVSADALTYAGGTPAAPTLSYQWNSDGVPIPGATGESYSIPLARRGSVITLTVTAAGTAKGTATSTASVPVQNVAAAVTSPVGELSVAPDRISSGTVAVTFGTTTAAELIACLVPAAGAAVKLTESGVAVADAAAFDSAPAKGDEEPLADGDVLAVLSEDRSVVKTYALAEGAAKAGVTLTFAEEGPKTLTFGDTLSFSNAADASNGGAVSYDSDNTTVATVDGTGTVTIHAVGTATITAAVAATDTHASGTAVYSLSVEPKALDGAAIEAIDDKPYTGAAATPTPAVTLHTALVAGRDFSYGYTGNVNAGTATVTITGKGNYTGTASRSFTITPAGITDLTAAAVTANTVSLNWTMTTGGTTGVTVLRQTEGGEFEPVLTLPGNAGSALVSGLTPNTPYYFKLAVTGGNNAGESNGLGPVETPDVTVDLRAEATVAPERNTITVSLSGAAFSPSLPLNSFSYSGADTAKFNGEDCLVTRVSDTIVRFTLKTGNWTPGEHILTVTGAALASGGSAASASCTADSFYQIAGELSLDGVADPSVNAAGKTVELYAGTIALPGQLLSAAQSDAAGRFTFPVLVPAGDYVLTVREYPATQLELTALAAHQRDVCLSVVLGTLETPLITGFTEEGIVTWSPIAPPPGAAVTYDVLLYRADGDASEDYVHRNTFESVSSPQSVLGEMQAGGAGVYAVSVRANADGYRSAESGRYEVTRRVGKAAVSGVAFSDPVLSWTRDPDQAAGITYYIRIYNGTLVVASLNSPADATSVDLSALLSPLTASGEYWATVQPLAASAGEGLGKKYTGRFLDGDESEAVFLKTVSGSIPVVVATAAELPAGILVPPDLSPSGALSLSPGDGESGQTPSLIITASSGVARTGSASDAFANRYTGYMATDFHAGGDPAFLRIESEGAQAGSVDGRSTQGIQAALYIDGGAAETDPVPVTVTYEAVAAVPFYLNSDYAVGILHHLTAGVDLVPDPLDKRLVYFVTDRSTFSFTDTTRGNLVYTYENTGGTGTSGETWTIAATVTSFAQFSTAINGAAAADPMPSAVDTVTLDADLSGSGFFSFGPDNRGFTVDGGGHTVDFGLFFGVGARDITLRNLKIVPKSSGNMPNPDGYAAVALCFGEHLTLDNVTVTMDPGADHNSAVYIGAGIGSGVTLRGCVVSAGQTKGWSAAVFVSGGAFGNLSMSGNTLTGYSSAIAIDMTGVTLTDANYNNLTQNTLLATNGAANRLAVVTGFDVPFRKPSSADTERIDLPDYFGGAYTAQFLTALGTETVGVKEGFSLRLVHGSNSASLQYTGGGWVKTSYLNSGTLSALIPQTAVYYEESGHLVITMNAEMNAAMADITLGLGDNQIQLGDTGGGLLGLGCVADQAGNYYNKSASGALCAEDGEWFWSGTELVIRIGRLDNNTVNGDKNSDALVYHSAGVMNGDWTEARIYFFSWYTAAGYNSGSATSLSLSKDPGGYPA